MSDNKKAKAAPKAKEESFKYGIEDLADKLKIKPASARVQLRSKNIKKAGKSYGWNSQAELDEVVKKLQPKDKADKKAPVKATAKKPAAKKVEKEPTK